MADLNPEYYSVRKTPNRNQSVNFNYVFEPKTSNWVPMQQRENVEGSLDYILNNVQEYVHKFGSHPNINQNASFENPYTIWDGSTKYVFPLNEGEAMEIVSDNTSDTQLMYIEGLDENFTKKIQEINLNGTTPVQLTGSWSRIHRSYNNGSEDLSGDVSVRGQETGNTFAKILKGNNQTLMSVYTVPADFTGYLLKYSVTAQNIGSSSSIGFTVHMLIREHGKVFRVATRTSAGTNYSVQEEYPFPLKLNPRSDIIFNVVNANGNNGSINADFDIALL